MIGDLREITDYDYFLVHLLESNSAYRAEIELSRGLGREIILDNSIFELGQSFNQDKFAYFIRLFKPTEFIIPDVLENYEKTISNFKEFIRKYPKLEGKKIGVVQGSSEEECFSCYKELVNLGAEKIAISFDYKWYEESRKSFFDLTKYHNWMWGRINFLKKLIKKDFFREEIPLHLLGCGLPQEFCYYGEEEKKYIESIDTSNPVIHGLHGIEYIDLSKEGSGEKEKWGLFNKKSKKLAEMIDYLPEVREWDLVVKNIAKFKSNLI
jgi:hypothetical protein